MTVGYNIFQFSVDYSKLPRSSGDGMEFSSSNSSNGSSSEGSENSDSSQRINKLLAATGQRQTLPNHATNTSTGLRTNAHPKIFNVNHNSAHNQVQQKQGKEIPSVYPRLIQASQLQEGTITATTRTESVQLNNDVRAKPIQRQNSTNLLLQGTELPLLNSQLGLMLNTNDQLVSLAPPVVDLGFGEGLPKSTIVEQTAEFIDSQKVINGLEEHNSKLVEEKTKLSVQLGVQTKVWISNTCSYLIVVDTLDCIIHCVNKCVSLDMFDQLEFTSSRFLISLSVYMYFLGRDLLF